MQFITQEHLSGCAVACVAALLNISYNKALKLFKYPEHAAHQGYYCKEIVQALSKGGKEYEYQKITAKNKHLISMSGVIIFLKKGKKYPIGHYLARLKNLWMDSWINHPKINPAKGGFRNKIPEKAQWIIYPIDYIPKKD